MFLNFLGAGLGVSRTQQEVFSESPVKVLERSAGEPAELAEYNPLVEVHGTGKLPRGQLVELTSMPPWECH